MKAVEEAIHICQDKNILKAYLETRKAELMDFMDYVFNQEAITRDWVEHECRKAEARGEARGRTEGEARGRTEAQLMLIANLMRSMSLTSDVAMEALNIPLEERAHYAEQLARQNA
jgi:predicted transposase YdaD